MLTEEEFNNWCKEANIPASAKEMIDKIRTSPPGRRVNSSRNNVSGRYPSKKMGLTIQFESHKNELSAILEYEYDENILEYYDQPYPPIKLSYKSKKGKQIQAIHTPDFFVIRKEGANWVECKMEDELITLSEQQPFRYCRDENGVWRCPPGEDYAAQLGFSYKVRSSFNNKALLLRNIEFLEDYLRFEKRGLSTEEKQQVISIVSNRPGITLEQLLKENIDADVIYQMIALKGLYADLTNIPLVEVGKVNIFLDNNQFTKFNLAKEVFPSTFESTTSLLNLSVGEKILWDGVLWTIGNLGENQVALIHDNGSASFIAVSLFLRLMEQNIIRKIDLVVGKSNKSRVDILLEKASPEDLERAKKRHEIIKQYLEGETLELFSQSKRTILYWLSAYKAAEIQYGTGNGYLGLLPQENKKGNRTQKISAQSKVLINQFIEEEYETLKQKTMLEVYGSLVSKCQSLKIASPSYKTFTTEVKNRSQYEQILKRKGSRAAYQVKDFYYDLDINTPRHGDRPFHICHLDHTELDVELVCSTTHQKLGKPWLSIMVDAFSRRVLAAFLTYDPPSYRSCMMTMRECVRRYGRFPQILVVDGGREFDSIYFETLLARYECVKKTRPAAKPRFGSVIERLFGTTNTRFIHNLLGNTQITKDVRQVTKSVNPKNLAVWTLGALYERLCEWAYNVYDTTTHQTLGQSPRDAFTMALMRYGYRQQRQITYDNEFRILTLPTTTKGTARVSPGKGIKVNNIYYWSKAFRSPTIEGQEVPIKYDPYDAGTAYAYVNNLWVSCISQYYTVLHQRSERELMILSSELKKRYQQHSKHFTITARKIADFLTTTQADEVLLSQQLKDKEAKIVLKLIEGGQFKSVTINKESSQAQELKEVEQAIDYSKFQRYEEF